MAKKMPMRKCVGCGEVIMKKELLRIIKTKENEIKLDATGKQNGRGAYLHMNPECLKSAIKKKGLERAFKISIPKEIYETLDKEMSDIENEAR